MLHVNNCAKPEGNDTPLSAARRLCPSLVAYYGLPEFAELETKFRPHAGLKQKTAHKAVDEIAVKNNDYRTRGMSLSALLPETIDVTLAAHHVNIEQDSKASETFAFSRNFLPDFVARSTFL